MQKFRLRWFSVLPALAACAIMALTSGCASGGFKLTRQYARWVNSQNIILRIILYIFTYIVFAVTLLIDMVIFNTIDFWEGKVSAGDYQFKEGTKTFHVRHEILPNGDLRRSTIRVMGNDGKQIQEVVLGETTTGEIEMFVDGILRTRVSGIKDVPVAMTFDRHGKLEGQSYILFDSVAGMGRSLNR